MSPNAMATLIILTAMAIGTIAILATCGYRFRRTWTAATQGRYAPALQHLIINLALSALLLNTAFDPPFPISWNEPIRCATQTCVWEYYYVLVVITLVLLTLAATAAMVAFLCTVLRAMVASEPGESSTPERPYARVKGGDSHV